MSLETCGGTHTEHLHFMSTEITEAYTTQLLQVALNLNYSL
jgi:hypothetical protein